MRYNPDDFELPAKVCLTWIRYFQKNGIVEVNDLKQAFADIANSFEDALEENTDYPDSTFVTWNNVVCDGNSY